MPKSRNVRQKITFAETKIYMKKSGQDSVVKKHDCPRSTRSRNGHLWKWHDSQKMHTSPSKYQAFYPSKCSVYPHLRIIWFPVDFLQLKIQKTCLVHGVIVGHQNWRHHICVKINFVRHPVNVLRQQERKRSLCFHVQKLRQCEMSSCGQQSLLANCEALDTKI